MAASAFSYWANEVAQGDGVVEATGRRRQADGLRPGHAVPGTKDVSAAVVVPPISTIQIPAVSAAASPTGPHGRIAAPPQALIRNDRV